MSTRKEIAVKISDQLKKQDWWLRLFTFGYDTEDDLTKFIKVEKRIGGKSRFGEAYKVSLKGQKFALKVIPSKAGHQHYLDWELDEARHEVNTLKDISALVLNDTCPNLPISFATFRCEKTAYQNPNLIVKEAPPSSYIIANELCDTDLRTWRKSYRTPLEWKNYVVQFLAGVGALEEHMNLVHGDLHDGNVIGEYLLAGGFWHYMIVDHSIYVPNLGIQWRLWDFGQCRGARQKKNEDMIENDLKLHFYGNLFSPPDRMKLRDEDMMHVIECLKSVERSPLRLAPALQMILLLGWFTEEPPKESILNDKPFKLV